MDIKDFQEFTKKIKKLMEFTMEELIDTAKELKIKIEESITKQELAELIAKAKKELEEKIEETPKGKTKQSKKGSTSKTSKKKKSIKTSDDVERFRKLAKSTLMKKTKQELAQAAKKLGIKLPKGATKAQIIELIKSSAPAESTMAKAAKQTIPKKETAGQKLEGSNAPEANGKNDYKQDVESSRFDAGSRSSAIPEIDEIEDEFSFETGQTMLILLPRDANWIFLTWELAEEDKRTAAGGRNVQGLEIRIYDLGVRGSEESKSLIARINPASQVGNWFFDTKRPNHVFEAEAGIIVDGRFVSMIRSNRAFTAPDSESPIDDPYFVTIPPNIPLPELKQRLQKLGVTDGKVALHLSKLGLAPPVHEGFVLSKENMAQISERIRKALASGDMPTSKEEN